MMLRDLGLDAVSHDAYETVGMQWLTRYRRVVSSKTTNRRLTSLRAYGKWAGMVNPLNGYRAPTGRPADPHPLPGGVADIKRMIDATDRPDMQTLIVLCGLLGTRVSEGLSLTSASYDVHTKRMHIFGKGEKWRWVPVSSAAFEYLADPIVRNFGSPAPMVGLADRHARDLVTKIAQRAGIERRVASHDLRATFATEVYRKTKDIKLVRDLLGHATTATTEGYIKVLESSMHDGVEIM